MRSASSASVQRETMAMRLNQVAIAQKGPKEIGMSGPLHPVAVDLVVSAHLDHAMMLQVDSEGTEKITTVQTGRNNNPAKTVSDHRQTEEQVATIEPIENGGRRHIVLKNGSLDKTASRTGEKEGPDKTASRIEGKEDLDVKDSRILVDLGRFAVQTL